jgi:hypothetical protein
VRLGDGNVVFAYVVFGGPLAAGDAVMLLKQPRLLGPPSYEVIGRNK